MVKISCGKCSNAFELPDAKAAAEGICPVCGEGIGAPQISRLAVASLMSAVFAAAVFLVPRIAMTFFRLRLRVFMNPGIFILFIAAVLLAVVFGYIARSRIRRSNGELRGEGFATAGIRIGWMGTAYLVFMTTVLFSFYFSTRQHVLSSVSPDSRTRLVVERRYGRNVMSYALIKKPNSFLPSRGEYLGVLDFREYDFPEDTYIVWSSDPGLVAVWFGEQLVWGYNFRTPDMGTL